MRAGMRTGCGAGRGTKPAAKAWKTHENGGQGMATGAAA